MARPRKDGTAEAPKKHPGGRPEKYTKEWLIEEAKAFKEWAIKPRSLWLKGFAYERGYHPRNLSEFADRSSEFSEALDFAKDEQERKFIDGAWSKEMDINFVRFFMPRMLKDRPEWRNSWDQPEERAETQVNITVNKI